MYANSDRAERACTQAHSSARAKLFWLLFRPSATPPLTPNALSTLPASSRARGGGEALRYSWLYRWRLYVFLPFPSVLFCPFVRSSVSSPALDRTRFSRPAVVGLRVFKSSQKARLAIKLPANARSRRIKANAARDGEKERKRGRANQPVRRRESG